MSPVSSTALKIAFQDSISLEISLSLCYFNLLRFLDVPVSVFHHIWKNLGHYVLQNFLSF